MSSAWPLVALGEVATPVERPEVPSAGTVYRQIGVRLWGEGAYERESIDGSQTKYKTLSRVDADDIIVNKIWARNGSVAVVSEALAGCFGSGEFPTFAPNKTQLHPRWIHWLTKTKGFWEQCDDKSRGTSGKNRIRPERFLEITIHLPSLAEQQRIVARIEELAVKIEEARKLRRQAVEEAESVYQSFLSKVMETHHINWIRKTIGDVIVSMDAGWSPQCDERPANTGEWGILRTTSVQWCEFRQFENKLLPSSLSPRPELSVEVGDVLVTRAGPRKRVGVVAAVRETARHLMISDKLIRLRPDQSKLLPRFLELAIASPFSQEHLVNRKTGLADAQVNISQAILRSTPISYPSLEEQSRIVDHLDDLQTKVASLKRLQTETSAELQAMLPSILTKAFQGTL